MTWSPREPDRVTTCTPLDTRGPKRLWDLPAGVVTRERGDLERIVEREYLCPVHGRFVAWVQRNNIPDDMPCPHSEEPEALFLPPVKRMNYCGRTSPWSPSTVATWKSAGEVSG